MKVQLKNESNIMDKSIEEFIEVMNDPKKQKGMTLGEVVQLVSVLERVAESQRKIENPQGDPALEEKIRKLESKVETLEQKITNLTNFICKVIGHGGEYEDVY